MNIIIADDDQNLLAMLVPYLEHEGREAGVVQQRSCRVEQPF